MHGFVPPFAFTPYSTHGGWGGRNTNAVPALYRIQSASFRCVHLPESLRPLQPGEHMKIDQYFGLILLLCSCLLIFYLIPSQIKGEEARLFPYFTVIITGLLSIGLLCNKNKNNDSPGLGYILRRKDTIAPLLISIVLLFAYYFMVDYFGFYIPSFILMVSLLHLFGVRSFVWKYILPVTFCLVIYLCVDKLLAFQMPLSRFW